MNVIGITGGIASGKSTVTSYLLQNGYFVIDCDAICHHLYSTPTYIKIVTDLFGSSILVDGHIDSAKIRNHVFKDKNNLKKLNAVIHPIVFQKIKEILKEFSDMHESTVFIDAPVLFESKLDKEFHLDSIWVVYVSKETQVKRLRERNPNMPEEDIYNIIKAQMSNDEKKALANVVLNNEGNIEKLYDIIDEELRKL